MKRIAVLLAVIASAGLMAACGGKDDNSSSASSDPYGSTTKTTADATATSAPVAETGQTLALSTNDELGKFLVGPNGHTLYLFEKDTGTTTACTGGCVNAWPALTATSPTVASGIDQSKVSTANGEAPNQVVYNGHLLYYFSGDTKAGDTNGLGIPAWYPVDASGNKIDKD